MTCRRTHHTHAVALPSSASSRLHHHIQLLVPIATYRAPACPLGLGKLSTRHVDVTVCNHRPTGRSPRSSSMGGASVGSGWRLWRRLAGGEAEEWHKSRSPVRALEGKRARAQRGYDLIALARRELVAEHDGAAARLGDQHAPDRLLRFRD